MLTNRFVFMVVLFACTPIACGETFAHRPALEGAKTIAECKLQVLTEKYENANMQRAVSYMVQPLPENPLDNYERTPLGDWRMPADVDRNDPWLRLLLLGPKQSVVIDLAVFIDGRPFRESREAWIDELLRSTSGNNATLPEGTKPADAASEESPASDAPVTAGVDTQSTKDTKEEDQDTKVDDENKVQDDAKPAPPKGIAPQSRRAPTMGERLKDYLVAGGGAVDRVEIRWLIAEWGSGPPVLLLGPSLSWQRAGLAPLLAYLDREQDGGLSAAETSAADETLRRADVDANDVLDASEIRRASDRPAAMPFDTDHSLLVELDEATDWDALSATMARIYGEQRASATADAESARELMRKPADVTLRVDFGTTEKHTSGVSVVAVSSELGDTGKVVTATKDVVTLDLGADYIEFSAAQGKAGDKSDVSATQVAFGAAIDGNPLLRLLDRDNDQRLTMRERQEVAGLLSALDRNSDGTVAASEMPMPIRIAVTLGPHVHQLLATPVGAVRAIAPRESEPAAPSWFASMDKNHDGDLSRGEFLGTSEQFRQIDADSDGLVSVAEATKLGPVK